MINQVVLVGTIIDKDIVKNKDNEFAIIKLSIPRPFKNDNGKYDSDIVSIYLYENLLQTVKNNCKKGDFIGVRGRISNLLNDTKIVVEKLSIVDKK